MTFSAALSNAISGLNAATTRVQVHSANIANATTPGYARRELSVSPGLTGGARIISIDRTGDDIVTGNRLLAGARAEDAQIRADATAQLNGLFGLPGDAQGLFSQFAALESALQDLSSTPESAAFQRGLLTVADDLTRSFNRIGDGVVSARTDADRAIAATVAQVNSALRSLEELNGAAGVNQSNGLSPVAEQRAELINTIGSALSIRVDPVGEDQVRILTAEGVTLLGETARTITFQPGGIVTAGSTVASGHLSGLSVDGIDITPGTAAQGIEHGSLAAQFSVRDEIAVAFNERLDALAENLVSRFSDPAGDSTLTGGAEGLFVSNGVGAGIASRMGVNAAVDPDRGGALFRLRDGVGAATPGNATAAGVIPGLIDVFGRGETLSTVTDSPASLSIIEATASMASALGRAEIDRNASAAATTATLQSLADAELSATGVNTDQELQSLLLVEQAYAANARVVQVVDDMMARLLEI